MVDEVHGRTAVSTQVGFIQRMSYVDISAHLPQVASPTLVVTTEESGLPSVEETRAWQQRIPRSKALVLPGNSFHVVGTHADQCVQAALTFISEHVTA